MMSDIEDLLAKLDIPTPENTGKINVYYLENAESEEVAKVLSSLTEEKPGARQAAAGRAPTIKGIITAELEGGVKITADKATNSLIIIDWTILATWAWSGAGPPRSAMTAPFSGARTSASRET
jgi:type II secretory pathway component GspD/PulD (secretin)